MEETKVELPTGMIQVGVIRSGGGVNIEAYREEEEKKGRTCVPYKGGYLVCEASKGKKR